MNSQYMHVTPPFPCACRHVGDTDERPRAQQAVGQVLCGGGRAVHLQHHSREEVSCNIYHTSATGDLLLQCAIYYWMQKLWGGGGGGSYVVKQIASEAHPSRGGGGGVCFLFFLIASCLIPQHVNAYFGLVSSTDRHVISCNKNT